MIDSALTDTVVHYPAGVSSDNAGDGVRTYQTGTTLASLVQEKRGSRVTAKGFTETYSYYLLYFAADPGCVSDDKFTWRGKSLFAVGSGSDMGGKRLAYVVSCEERV